MHSYSHRVIEAATTISRVDKQCRITAANPACPSRSGTQSPVFCACNGSGDSQASPLVITDRTSLTSTYLATTMLPPATPHATLSQWRPHTASQLQPPPPPLRHATVPTASWRAVRSTPVVHATSEHACRGNVLAIRRRPLPPPPPSPSISSRSPLIFGVMPPPVPSLFSILNRGFSGR